MQSGLDELHRGATEEWTQVFLLSPAHCGGHRAVMLMRPTAAFPLARRLQSGTLTLGEAFSFMSGLYFRGKLTYARAFASGQRGRCYVITPTRGLVPADAVVSAELLREFASTDIALAGARFQEPLGRDAEVVASRLSTTGRAVLLGSVATGKYVDVLTPAFGSRLCYPAAFVGRGDMSRGGLLLRCASSGMELDYVPLVTGIARRGKRPPRLDPVDAMRPRVFGR